MDQGLFWSGCSSKRIVTLEMLIELVISLEMIERMDAFTNKLIFAKWKFLGGYVSFLGPLFLSLLSETCFVSNLHIILSFSWLSHWVHFLLQEESLPGINLSFNSFQFQKLSLWENNTLRGDSSWISNLQMEHEKGSGKK